MKGITKILDRMNDCLMKWPMLVILLMTAIITTGVLTANYIRPFSPPKEQSQIKTCDCLTYYQWEYLSTKRNNVLEKLYNGKKSKRKDLNDSLNFYNHKLGLDETLNVYPER